MPDKGFAGVCSSAGFGHNSGGKSLKTSLIALSKDQVSISSLNLSALKSAEKSDLVAVLSGH